MVVIEQETMDYLRFLLYLERGKEFRTYEIMKWDKTRFEIRIRRDETGRDETGQDRTLKKELSGTGRDGTRKYGTQGRTG